MGANDQDPEELPVAKSHLGFPVVGIGASAGGIDALRRLFQEMPADSGMAFVVVMHLSPDHESSLAEILQRSTSMSIVAVTQATPIEANHIYVISPALKLAMCDGHLGVSPLTTLEGRRQSIDLFFRSLAQAHRERSVGVVLSGTGSDGAQGLKRIKELGGVAIAQSPEDAEFDGMPRAAAQTGQVDFVLPIAEMPDKLLRLWENAKRIELPKPPLDLEVQRSAADEESVAEEALISIKALLRERTGHDFGYYKRGTVLRRLERRMQVNALPDLPSYRRLLDAEPNETPALLQDMLISVTNFFRDPEAFAALSDALGASIAERHAEEPFRAWVAGCATGEEAFSVAILLRELLGPSAPPIQVFASDIDQRAVAFARAGLFPRSIEADVSAERLRGFFVRDPVGYKVVKPLREAIVFSAHNVLSDPPFTRMDLICCRNLMIYLDRPGQEQLLRHFHYALKPRGLLFLGTSETVDAASELFDSVDRIHRVYRSGAGAPRARVLPTLPARISPFAPPSPHSANKEPARPPLEALHDRVVRGCAPPTVLVDADDTVLHVSERASHLLRLPEGAPTNKLMALVRPELRAELRAAMSLATRTAMPVEAPRVQLSVNGETREIAMRARPAIHQDPKGLTLIEFDEYQASLAGSVRERDPVVATLEAELILTQERLRGTLGESAASTEELRASNEELQTINEELRSTTEELETSREELQALNEELTTVNSELTVRVEDARKADDDWKNLLASAEIGTVFIDKDGLVKRFTPQAATLFNLLPKDLGRPLRDITHRMDYPSLGADITTARRELKRFEREVQADDGRTILARVAPYRTSDDRIEGTALALFDVTALRAVEGRLLASEDHMALIAENMRDYAILTMDPTGHFSSWSSGAEKTFGYTAAEAIGRHFELLFTDEDKAAGVPAEELRVAARSGRANDDRWLATRDGRRIFCSGVTASLGVDGAVGFAKIARNFTDEEMLHLSREAALTKERATSGRLQELNAMKDEFLAIVSHELKNPLSIIQMNAQLITRLPESAAGPKAVRSAQTIIAAVASQAQIINDLLELSRANMGKIALAPDLLDLPELVEGIAEAAKPDADAKSQTLSIGLTPVRIFGDRVRVEQIVWNLIVNAIKFTPEGGAIRVELRVERGMAHLSVKDTGIGLAAADLSNIFEMFKQADSGAGRAKTGLGIGLALVKRLAELHGGRVTAESEGAGRGARFNVWLPLPDSESPTLPETVESRGLRGLRLLAVDDEPDVLTAFGDLLEMEGARVALANNARQALEMALAESFDAVISDIAMPGEDGLWLAKRLREEEGTRGVPLVAVSGMARAPDRARAIEAGFDALLAKPLDLTALCSEIVHALRKRMS
ncbi:chemotaxis protein CheB [soil metagenome]